MEARGDQRRDDEITNPHDGFPQGKRREHAAELRQPAHGVDEQFQDSLDWMTALGRGTKGQKENRGAPVTFGTGAPQLRPAPVTRRPAPSLSALDTRETYRRSFCTTTLGLWTDARRRHRP